MPIGADKKDIYEQSGAAVRLALGETELVLKTKKFLEDHGVHLSAFGKAVVQRSKNIILVKNLPAKTKAEDLLKLFEKFGSIVRLVVPPSGVTALIEYTDGNEAKAAFKSLAYRRFKDLPLYLEWAPADAFQPNAPLLKDLPKEAEEKIQDTATVSNNQNDSGPKSEQPQTEVTPSSGTIFVKNLNFNTTEEDLKQHFVKMFGDKVDRATIAKNKDTRQKILSLGYGFVEFTNASVAQEALKRLQHSELDGHKLELKFSTAKKKESSSNKKADDAGKPSTRILVRNIPFEANANDVKELFTVFGNIRSVRLPKKAITRAIGNVSGRSGGGRDANLHRGFGFVDFHSVDDAKRAFDALRFSTHLYGRRMVLEWAKTDESELVEDLRAKAAERAVASAHAAQGAVHKGAAKRLRKADVVASVEKYAKQSAQQDDGVE